MHLVNARASAMMALKREGAAVLERWERRRVRRAGKCSEASFPSWAASRAAKRAPQMGSDLPTSASRLGLCQTENALLSRSPPQGALRDVGDGEDALGEDGGDVVAGEDACDDLQGCYPNGHTARRPIWH